MEDETLGIAILITAVLLLGLAFYTNISGTFNFLADPLAGDGFGTLCDNEDDCGDFCQNNFGRCGDYCTNNPSNELCSKLFGRLR